MEVEATMDSTFPLCGSARLVEFLRDSMRKWMNKVSI
jgi:hypothetical protein